MAFIPVLFFFWNIINRQNRQPWTSLGAIFLVKVSDKMARKPEDEIISSCIPAASRSHRAL